MPYKQADRILEVAACEGTGDVILQGAFSAAFKSFASVMAVGDTTTILIESTVADEAEVCDATLAANGRLQRGAVLSSSQSDNARVSFLVGQKRVMMTNSVHRVVRIDPTGLAVSPPLPPRNLVEAGIVSRLWTFSTPGGEPIYSSPIGPVTIRKPGGQPVPVVVFNAWDWWTYALHAVTGAQVYRKAADGPKYGRSQAADVNGDGLVEIFSPSHDGLIWSITDDFANRWQFPCLYLREATGTVTGGDNWSINDSSKAWAQNSFMRSTTDPAANANIAIPSIGYVGKVANCHGAVLVVEPDFSATGQPAIGAAYSITPAWSSDIVFMHAGTLVQEGASWFLYVTSFDNTLTKIDADTGAKVWNYATLENIEPYPLLADVDNDGVREIIIGSIDGIYRCFKANGTLVWQNTLDVGPVDAFGNAGDVNGDGAVEVIVSGRDGRVHILNGQTGAQLFSTTTAHSWSFPEINSSATPIDVGGAARIFVGGDAGTAWSFDLQGNTVWSTFVVPQSINSSPIFHDVDGDGEVEMLIGDMRGTLWVFNVRTGAVLGCVYVKGGIEGVPLYADIDGDGKMEMVVTTADGHCIAYRFERGAQFVQPYLPGDARFRGHV